MLYLFKTIFINLISRFNQKMIDFNKLNMPLDLADFHVVLQTLYKERSGYNCSLSREDQTLAMKKIFLTYGEILPEGLAKLFDFVKVNPEDSFVDLGSGAGKAVLQSYLCTDMHSSYGVEIDEARFQISVEAIEDLKQKAPHLFADLNKKIYFLNKNITDFDFSKVSLVFSNATCFGPNLMGLIAEQINNNPNVRAAMSTHKIEGLLNLTQENIVDIEVSWHIPPNTSPCYVYTKPD